MKSSFFTIVFIVGACTNVKSQSIGREPLNAWITDSIPDTDTALRITNLNPFFTHHVDSVNVYQFSINKPSSNYYWFLKNAPVGLNINKDHGTVTFRAAKNYFQSGRMKYDFPYIVEIGVQNLHNPTDRIDTFFTILFFNTEIIPSRLKPSVGNTINIDEGDTLSFRLQCEKGSFPIETIIFNSSIPLRDYSFNPYCAQEFRWVPSFDFVKETDQGKTKTFNLTFIGITRFKSRDTVTIRVSVRDGLNYINATENYNQAAASTRLYILQLKYAFLQLDRKLKRVKSTRLAFDLTSGATALTGTILNTSSDAGAQKAGKVLPSVGLALSPVKEAAAANKPVEQNQAAAVRASIKRLEYMLQDNQLTGPRDPDILRKTQKLKDEVKQVQVQLIDIPMDLETILTEQELNNYFNSKKVNKKYRLKQ